MAFCPECGKAVTPDEAVCTSCGKQLRSDDKKSRGGRFHGTMMMTAPEVKQEQPANINAERAAQEVKAVASAAGATSPRLGAPIAAKRSSRPPSAKSGSNYVPNPGAASIGRPNPLDAKATMIGAGIKAPEAAQAKPQPKSEIKNATMIGAGIKAPEAAQAKPQPKSEIKNATMLGAALAPTVPRSKPPGAAKTQEPASDPAPTQQVQSDRPMARHTSPQGSNNASVRAVQSVPVSPSPDGPAKPRTAVRAQSPAEVAASEARTNKSPLPERKSPNPARMVQAIPEVQAYVVEQPANDARTVPREYLPGDPMAPQPPAAARAARPRPFAPENPEEEGQGNYILLYWAVCVAVVAAVSALAFRLF